MKKIFSRFRQKIGAFVVIASFFCGISPRIFAASGDTIDPSASAQIVAPSAGIKIKNGPNAGFTAKVEVSRGNSEIGGVNFLVFSNDQLSALRNARSARSMNNFLPRAERSISAEILTENFWSGKATYGKYFRTENWAVGEKILAAVVKNSAGEIVAVDVTGPVFEIIDENSNEDLPDLRIENFSFYRNFQNAENIFVIKIKNDGQKKVEKDFFVKLKNENSGKISTKKINLGWSQNGEFIFAASAIGISTAENFEISVVLDPENEVAEKNEENNVETKNIFVDLKEKEKIDFLVKNLRKSDAEKYAFQFDLCAFGGKSLQELKYEQPELRGKNLQFEYFIKKENGEKISGKLNYGENCWLEELKNGKCNSTTFYLNERTFAPHIAKTGEIEIVFDPENIIPENNENNNSDFLKIDSNEFVLPDLQIKNLNFFQNWRNQKNVVVAEIWNFGDKTALLENGEKLTAQIYLNNKQKNADFILPENKIAKNNFTEIFFEIDQKFFGIENGSHEVRISVDQHNFDKISESNENNNWKIENIFFNFAAVAEKKINLVVENFWFQKNTKNILAKICNHGDKNFAGNLITTLFSGEKKITSHEWVGLNLESGACTNDSAGSHAHFSISENDFPENKFYFLKVATDSENKFVEWNENDNFLQKNIFINFDENNFFHDLAVSDIEILRSDTEKTEIKFVAKNYGNLPSKHFQLQVFFDGKFAKEFFINTGVLAPEKILEKIVEKENFSTGWHSIKIILKTDDDKNLQNNILEKKFFVQQIATPSIRPDLLVEDIWANQENLFAKVCNRGDAIYNSLPENITTYFFSSKNKFFDGGTGGIIKGYFGINECQNIFMPFSKLGISTSGEYNFKVGVHSKKIQKNWENDFIIKTIFVNFDEEIKNPDLIVEKIRFEKNENKKAILAKICNFGTENYFGQNLETELFLNRKKIATHKIPTGLNLLKNNCVEVDFLIYDNDFPENKNYYLIAKTDTTNLVSELNENNNFLAKNIFVNLNDEIEKPDLMITDFWVEQNEKNEKAILAKICNHGNEHFSGKSVMTKLFLNGKFYTSTLSDLNLEPGKCSFNNFLSLDADDFPENKNYHFIVKTDFDNKFSELNENNNFLAKNIFVNFNPETCEKIWTGYIFDGENCIKKITESCTNPFNYSNFLSCKIKNIFNYEPEIPAENLDFFVDTDSNSIEGIAAAYLREKNIIGGRPPNENGEILFDGGAFVNRAEIAKFLSLGAEIEVGNIFNNGKFSDVPENSWYRKYVMKMATTNPPILNGYSDGTFKPGKIVNTAEFLKMATGSFNFPKYLPQDFEDVDSDDWFNKYAGLAQKYNLFPHRDPKILDPSKELTRNEVAVAIYKILTFNEDADFEIPILENNRINILSAENHRTFSVHADEQNILAHSLKLNSPTPKKINSIKFRIAGNGRTKNFDKVWLEEEKIDGEKIRISDKISIAENNYFVEIPLSNFYVENFYKKINLKVDMAEETNAGDSLRFAIFLPEWIDTDGAPTGFFPFSGHDLQIK